MTYELETPDRYAELAEECVRDAFDRDMSAERSIASAAAAQAYATLALVAQNQPTETVQTHGGLAEAMRQRGAVSNVAEQIVHLEPTFRETALKALVRRLARGWDLNRAESYWFMEGATGRELATHAEIVAWDETFK